MNLKKYIDKEILLTDEESKEFKGFVTDYVFPEDNEPEEESIIIETSDGKSIEFRKSEIKEIKELS